MILLFNGPPESGKDDACDFLSTRMGYEKISFKTKLFSDTKRIFEISDENFADFMNGYSDRKRKDVERPNYLGGMNRREAMIFSSEHVTKKIWGNGYYGKKVSEIIEDHKEYCSSDCGFVEEINELRDFQPIICQIVRTKKSFVNDSRTYVTGNLVKEFGKPETFSDKIKFIDDIPTIRIWNTGSLAEFLENIKEAERFAKNVYSV